MVIIICTKKNYGYYYKVSRIQEKKIEGVSDRVYGSRFEEFPKEFWFFFFFAILEVTMFFITYTNS